MTKLDIAALPAVSIALLSLAVGYGMGTLRLGSASRGGGAEASSTKLGSAIHEYLIAHPDVLPEMSAALQRRQRTTFDGQAKKALAESRAEIFNDPADGGAGSLNGPKVVVEFFDYQCPFCKQLSPDLSRLLAQDHDVRIIYKEFPILGGGSIVAAKAALAAAKQDRYASFHDALMSDKSAEGQLSETRIFEIAKAVGLDVEHLKADMASPEIDAKISANLALGKKLGINGTPDLIVADRVVPGLMPYDQIRKLLADQAAAVPVGEGH